MLPLFRSDIFVKENVGTEEQREDLKKQILHAKENNIGGVGGSNDGCWRSSMRYKNIEWLTNCMLDTASEATIYYAEQDLLTTIFHEFVHIKQHIKKEFGGDIFAISNDKVAYEDRPYEIEAFRLEKEMLEEYNNVT